MATLIDRLQIVIRTAIERAFCADALSPEYQEFRRSLSDLEQRQLETDVLTTELEARINVLEQAADDHDDA